MATETLWQPRERTPIVGDFAWCIEHLDLEGEAALNAIVKGVESATTSGTARCPEPSRSGHVCWARHWIWYFAYHHTDLHPETIGRLTGGFTAGSVRRWASEETWRQAEGDYFYTWPWSRLRDEFLVAINLGPEEASRG